MSQYVSAFGFRMLEAPSYWKTMNCAKSKQGLFEKGYLYTRHSKKVTDRERRDFRLAILYCWFVKT